MSEATTGQKLKRAMRRAVLRIFPSCKEVVKIISASLDRPLMLREKFLMKMHLFACKPCVRYLDQSSFLSRAVRLMDDSEKESLFGGSLSDETRARIKSVLGSSVALIGLFIVF